jgi:hypothetical protein
MRAIRFSQAAEQRDLEWSFPLTAEDTVAVGSGYTGFYVWIRSDTLPGTDQYFKGDLVALENPSGPEERGDKAALLEVDYCIPTPTPTEYPGTFANS